MKKWLAETHGAVFELVRHFLARFFDSDMVTDPGQWTRVLVMLFALLAPAFLLIMQTLRAKYNYFSHLANPEPYRHAVRADELWLITLGMSVVGLLTALQWQSLFPNRRNYLALGTLPVRTSEIFFAKFTSLILVISALILTLNALPSLSFPAASMSRWQVNPFFWRHVEAHAAACALAAYFFFFALVAMQGVLLSIFRAAWFARITNYLQGALIIVMLVLIVLSFSIGPAVERALLQPQVAKWLPPVWFLGLYQTLLQDPDPLFRHLADKAFWGLVAAVSVSLISYLISYKRHRELAVETMGPPQRRGRLEGWVLNRLIPHPRQQGTFVFMLKTLARSGRHRMVLMGHFGIALAVLLSGMAGMPALVKREQLLVASFAYAHMTFLLFLLLGLRQTFAIPIELSANWIFQLTERQGRPEWLRSVDRLAVFPALLLIVVAPAPVEIALLGWRGLGEATLFIAAYLLLYESLFYEWQKLPFACSYLPGRVHVFVTALRGLGVLTALPIINAIAVASLYNPWGYLFVFVALLVIWNAVRYSRRLDWGNERLRYEEDPEPAVRSLRLGTN